jgi:hypothetical protein
MEFIEKEENQQDTPLVPEDNINNFCIILTSTVSINPKKRFIHDTDGISRLKTYLKSITQWLEKTNFKIVLVENSGHNFSEIDDYIEKYKERF